MNVYGPRITRVFITPDMMEKLFPGEYLPRRRRQEMQKLEFLRRHGKLLAIAQDGVVAQVDAQSRIFNRSGGRRIRNMHSASAQKRVDAGCQLTQVNRLDEIIVRAHLQP